jgi:hypothetical protein
MTLASSTRLRLELTEIDQTSEEMDSRKGWTVVAAVTLVLMFTSGARLLPGIVL